MKNFSTYWLATIFAAIILHVAAAMGFSYVAPLFTPSPKIQTVVELEWVDVDFPEEIVIDDEIISSDAAQEKLPTFDAQALVVPEISVPELNFEPPKPIPPKPVERPKIPTVNNKPSAPPKVDKPEKVDKPQETRQLLAKPPVTVMEVYPEKESTLGYKGYVSIAVHIGADGKVKSTEILQSSGIDSVDEVSIKAAMQWMFKPALDQIGRPMECDKIITFDFKKFS